LHIEKINNISHLNNSTAWKNTIYAYTDTNEGIGAIRDEERMYERRTRVV